VSIGFAVTKAGVDQNLGVCSRALYNAFATVAQFKSWLDTQTVPNLEGLGYTTTEANTVKSVMADLDKLRTIWEGTGTQATVYDFRTFAKQAIGPGLT
jgi:hypothetical protein